MDESFADPNASDVCLNCLCGYFKTNTRGGCYQVTTLSSQMLGVWLAANLVILEVTAEATRNGQGMTESRADIIQSLR
jgi:hypothetical protein